MTKERINLFVSRLLVVKAYKAKSLLQKEAYDTTKRTLKFPFFFLQLHLNFLFHFYLNIAL